MEDESCSDEKRSSHVVFAHEELTAKISAAERKKMEKWVFTTLQLTM